MRSLSRSATRVLVLSSLGLFGFVVACTATGSAEGDLVIDQGSNQPADSPPSAQLPQKGPDPDDNGRSGGASTDAAPKKDSSAPVDAGADVWAPNPDEPCPTVNQIIKRACGICGTEEAVCLEDPSSPTGMGKVSPYGPCNGQVVGGCVPGSVTSESCGNCGTRQRTCTKYCAWNNGACTGEPANACSPGSRDYTTAGCPADGYRAHECTAACTWTNYPSTCGPLDFEMVASTTVTGEVSGVFPLRQSLMGKRLTGSCPNGTLSTTTKHPMLFVEVKNPTSQAMVVSAYNAQAPGGPIIDTMMASYAGAVRPVTDAERKACVKGAADPCPSGLGCSNSFAGITGVAIPANGSALIWFGAYYEAGSSITTEGNVKLVIRTDSLN